MTREDVRDYVAAHHDDDPMDSADLIACFRALYDRDPDDYEYGRIWSLICAEVC